MASTKTKLNFPKFYACKYGVFYEGQTLEQYCCSGNQYSYSNDVILVKFVVHYQNYKPVLYFQFHDVGKTRVFSLPVDGYLGILYRKCR